MTADSARTRDRAATRRLGIDPLRDHLTETCDPSICSYCAKRRRIETEALRAVANAALRYMEEGGEHPTDEGLHIGCAEDAKRLNAALDAWTSGRSDRGEVEKRAAMASGDCQCPTPNPDCEHPTCPRVSGSRPEGGDSDA